MGNTAEERPTQWQILEKRLTREINKRLTIYSPTNFSSTIYQCVDSFSTKLQYHLVIAKYPAWSGSVGGLSILFYQSVGLSPEHTTLPYSMFWFVVEKILQLVHLPRVCHTIFLCYHINFRNSLIPQFNLLRFQLIFLY